MSRDRSGYVFKDKDRKWFARVTLRDVSGKRRNIKHRAKDKTQAKQPFNAGSPLISSVDENKRDRVLTREEETRLLAAIGAEPKREHLRGILLVTLDCALRRGKILTLKWSDVDLERRTIHVRSINCKTARARLVAMTCRVYQELESVWLKGRQVISLV